MQQPVLTEIPVAAGAMTTDAAREYVWRWRRRLPERHGEACRVTARGSLNSVRVLFADGFWVITSRWAVRRAP